ncbi:MAG: TspO/MBR family protein [Cypionkella sp.]
MTALASRGQLRASVLRWGLFTVPLCLLGVIPGRLWTADTAWFQSLAKPAIFPPPIWFGIVWTTLFVLMGIALALVCSAWGARLRTPAISAFAAQFLVNLAWTPVFFGMQRISGGLIVLAILDVLVIVTVVLFWRVRRLAGALLLPYLAWILFATVLNWQFLALNPEGGVERADSGAQQRYEF